MPLFCAAVWCLIFFAAKQWACKVCRGNYTVHNKSLSPVSKEIGILTSHSQDIPVVASAFAHQVI